MKNFLRGLVLKQRHKATWKWPIGFLFLGASWSNTLFIFILFLRWHRRKRKRAREKFVLVIISPNVMAKSRLTVRSIRGSVLYSPQEHLPFSVKYAANCKDFKISVIGSKLPSIDKCSNRGSHAWEVYLESWNSLTLSSTDPGNALRTSQTFQEYPGRQEIQLNYLVVCAAQSSEQSVAFSWKWRSLNFNLHFFKGELR